MQPIPLSDLDLARWIRPGDTVLWSPSTAEPLPLVQALIDQRAGLGGVRILLGTSYSRLLQPELTDHLRFATTVGGGGARRLIRAGQVDILPVHASAMPELIRSGRLRIDVVLAQLAADESGRPTSWGTADLYMGAAMATARAAIVEINARAPCTLAQTEPDLSRVVASVQTDRPMVEVRAGAPDDIDRQIADRVARLIPDGAVLQVGIGGVSDALGEALAKHRDLGIHSGAIGDMVVELVERGVVTNARKSLDRGVSLGATLLGTQRLFDFAHRNPALRIAGSEHIHAPSVLAALDGLVSVNSAVEVDLTGQVNSEVAGDDYVGAVGGQVDFVRGAAASRGGLSIIALRATGPAGSRIVPRIASGVVTTARSDVGVVVTEHGVADLRGLPLAERCRRMIAIAAPEFREDLQATLGASGPAGPTS